MPLQDLPAGHKFPSESLIITETESAAYADAAGDTTVEADARGPSMRSQGSGLPRFIKHLGLANGTVEVGHASQEASFNRPVTPGEGLEIRATLKSNAERRGSRFATVEMLFIDEFGKEVATASSLIVVNAT